MKKDEQEWLHKNFKLLYGVRHTYKQNFKGKWPARRKYLQTKKKEKEKRFYIYKKFKI